jgi:mannose-6-phosphate isomerase-like protein (cupin superfamily)
MRQTGRVEKGWGYEEIWATNDLYCSKYMVFPKAGNKFSMHFHKEKDETWHVLNGSFKVRYIDTTNATMIEEELQKGSVFYNPPLQPHQLIALEDDSIILEVSTPDSVEDNYRIAPGDSQSEG